MNLDIGSLSKRFGTATVVANVNLKSKDSEFIVVVGPSGCGKTTLLRLVAGLEQADSGTIVVNDLEVDTLPPRDRNVAMVFQGESLYPHMTVRKNLEFPLSVRSLPQPKTKATAERVAEQLGVGELLDRYPETLSGGQRQRVALGRALVREPAVFLLDEPFSHLDAHLRRQLQQEMKALRKYWTATTLFVTHDLREAMLLGDRIAVMCDGEIHQFATPEKIRNEPATDFVAQFIAE